MLLGAIEVKFTVLDWVVLGGYLALTTVIGHAMRGKQATIRDFFAGGRSLPWQAVTGSIIATEISGVTFIGVPGMVMAANGNFGYIIWAFGSIIGRVLVGIWFVRTYYEDNIYSPYDYMGRRIGSPVKTLATVFFTIGSILGQSVRVLVAALPLWVVTDLPFEGCIVVIGLFAVVWTLMGGMRTVIWTDVMQFLLFTVGGLIALFWILGRLDGGWAEYQAVAGEAGKFQWWDARFGIAPEFRFTFWVAVFAVPFQNLTAFGVDQLNAQRMFCCRDAGAARKAIIWSSVGQMLTLLMLLVGAALFVWYGANPPTGEVAEKMQWNEGVPGNSDAVFPTWIVSELPPGLSGLILAAVFAAAISSLDSILAALSQTTISLIHHPDRPGAQLDHRRLVFQSRIWVVVWGLLLSGFTMLMFFVWKKLEINVLPLAFGMTSYTMGPLLGMFVAALVGRASFVGLLVGSVVSLVMVLFVNLDVWILIERAGLSIDWLAGLPTYAFDETGKLASTVDYVWAWPVTAALTFLCGWLPRHLGGREKG